jgi:(2R)-sulfolactate sulfo-lyase subunit beta
MGNIQKIGRCKIASVLKPAEEPKRPGLHFMDSSSAAAEMVTLCGAAGSVVHSSRPARAISSATPSCR